jgi:hypothetical protein
MKIGDEAAEWKRQKKAQKQKRYRMRQRGKAPDGGNKPRLIQIWVNDPEAWRAIHGVSEPTSLVAITEAHIIKQCRRYRKMEVEQAWGSIGCDYVFEDEAPKPLPPRTTPNAMTEEQEEIAGDDGIIFIEADDKRGLHPCTGGGRRVRTSRNHKRYR